MKNKDIRALTHTLIIGSLLVGLAAMGASILISLEAGCEFSDALHRGVYAFAALVLLGCLLTRVTVAVMPQVPADTDSEAAEETVQT